jgi:hypothetical protein
MTPIDKTEFNKLKCRGILSEMAVQESAIWNLDLYSSLTGHLDCNQILLTRDIKPSAPYDIQGYAVTGSHFHPFSVEVKSAANGGRYRTFFAELFQVGSMSYSEYLVHPPRFMVYVDTLLERHFWYDGQTFARAVKSHWADRIYNKRGTAAGVRFDFASKEYGFLWAGEQCRPHQDIYNTRQAEIEMMMQVQKDVPQNKICDGLPDLSTDNVI